MSGNAIVTCSCGAQHNVDAHKRADYQCQRCGAIISIRPIGSDPYHALANKR